MPIQRINLHLVSDATGETLNAIARATTVQFEHADIIYHRWSLIRTRFQLHRVLEGVEHEPGPVLSTLVDRALRDELKTTCSRLNVPVVNVLDPVMDLLQEFIGEQASARPGRQYVLNADYFRRIDAMHSVWRTMTVRRSQASPRPTWCWSASRGAPRPRLASIWPIAASRLPISRWYRICRSYDASSRSQQFLAGEHARFPFSVYPSGL